MMKNYFFFILLCSHIVLNSQTWDWAVSSGDPAGDAGEHIGIDNQGNVYITGYTTNYYTYTHRLLTKYNPTGNLIFRDTLWQFVVINSVTDTAGNTYVIGKNQKIGKYDKNGNQLWLQTIPNAIFERISLIPSGGIIVAGSNQLNHPLTFGTYNLSGSKQTFAARCDVNGTWLWTIDGIAANSIVVTSDNKMYMDSRSFSGQPYAVNIYDENGIYEKGFVQCNTLTKGLAVDGGKNFYLMYVLEGNSIVINGQTFNPVNPIQSTLILKSDSFGNIQWHKQIGDYVGGQKLLTDENNNIYLAGTFCRNMTIDNIVYSSPNNKCNVFVCKMDSAGNVVWVKVSQSVQHAATCAGSTNLKDLIIDYNGDVIITGGVTDTNRFDNHLVTGTYCSYPDLLSAKMSQPISSNEISEPYNSRGNISVFPNPSSTAISVSYANKCAENLILQIKNTLGQTIYTKGFPNSNSVSETLDVRHLSKGVYFIELRGDRINELRKIIVQ